MNRNIPFETRGGFKFSVTISQIIPMPLKLKPHPQPILQHLTFQTKVAPSVKLYDHLINPFEFSRLNKCSF